MARMKLQDLASRTETEEPYEIELTDGSVVTFPDPRSIHVQTLIEAVGGSPTDQLHAFLGTENADRVLADPSANAYGLQALLEGYVKHYGIPLPGNSGASRGSSRGTARR